MTTTMRLLPVRVSAELRGLIDQVGPVNPATRALILLGADAVGLELRGLEREIAGLLAAPLDADVQARLRQLFIRLTATAPAIERPDPPSLAGQAAQSPAHSPAAMEESPDPFASVGIEV
ncbi:hypothetical protein K2Z83_26745 [Oscillochloris sp. ZM17-4]|uniref:hypothetical protein n=1 Tax=Oscillochloris sp. ZM17-4 TaxID=2866714 RepID=UPI001C730A4B|nr:hypothetical protein [Oscillochloris sp. ZM17-4]MBX0331252.1 hypothetical protein [Oscillochloris sp. ZM17-4]